MNLSMNPEKPNSIVVVVAFCLLLMGFPSIAVAELKIESVYPTLGKLGQDLGAALTGSGFDENTRISMYLDTGDKKSILASVSTWTATEIATRGEELYLADYYGGFKIFDISESENPLLIGAVDTPGNASSMAIRNGMAYVTVGQNGLQVIDITDPEDPQTVGSADTPDNAKGIALEGDMAYVADFHGGLQVIDISVPEDPHIIGTASTAALACDIAIENGRAYVAQVELNDFKGLQVVDISNPQAPVIVGAVATPHNARGIAIADGKAYVANERNGLQVIDISDPTSPQIIGAVDTPDWAEDVFVSHERAYVADGNSGIQVIDIADPENPRTLGAVDTPGFAKAVAVAYGKIYAADDNQGFHVIDSADPIKPQLISVLDTPSYANDLAVLNEKAYVLDDAAGLIVVDIRDSQRPEIIGAVNWPDLGSPFTSRLEIFNGKAYVADVDLIIVDVSNPASPSLISIVDTPGSAKGIEVTDGYAFVAAWENGLQIVEINDPENPQIIGSVDTPNLAYDVAISGENAFVADGDSGLQVIDIGDPQNPWIISAVDTPRYASDVAVVDGKAYVADGHLGGLQVIDISDPSGPQIIGAVRTLGAALRIIIDGNIAYVADYDRGVQIIDISNPTAPTVIGVFDTPSHAMSVAFLNGTLYVTDRDTGFVIAPSPIEIIPIAINSRHNMSLVLRGPQMSGHYTLRAFDENESYELPGAVSFLEPEDWAVQNHKKAIIVAGGGPYSGNSLWDGTVLNANYAYRALQTQGYTRENIYYLNPEADMDADGDDAFNDVDAGTSKEELIYAVTDWAKDAIEVLLYMVDHGGNETFRLNQSAILSATELSKMLDTLQSSMPGKVILVYDACQSGSFLDAISPLTGREDDRVIVTSSAANERAWFINGGILSFSYQFWSHLRSNARLLSSYTVGELMMEGSQTAMIDANGNGMSGEAEDYAIASAVTICRGRVVTTSPPEIGQIAGEQILTGSPFADIWAKDIETVNGIDSIRAIINPPGYEDAPLDIPITDYPTVYLTDTDNDGIYSIEWDGFGRQGAYDITILATDTEGLFSLPKKTTVIQNSGDTAPLAMASPAGGLFNAAQSVRLIPSEQDATIYYAIDSVPTTESQIYHQPIEIAQDTTLNFLPVSSIGEEGQVYSESYEIDTDPPVAPYIDPDSNAATSVFNPYPTFIWSSNEDADHFVLQYADNYQFADAVEMSNLRKDSYTVKEAFPHYGLWHWRVASVDLAGNMSGWSTFQYDYQEDTKLHKAIIVAGSDSVIESPAWKATETIVKYAYDALVHQGYAKDTVHFLSAHADVDLDGNQEFDDVDTSTTNGDLQNAISTWTTDADDLLIFLVGRGTNTGYTLSATEELVPADLKSWSDELQSALPGKVYVILDFDYSGAFLAHLSVPPEGKERVVISSTKPDETALFMHDGILSFSYQFWSSIYYNSELYGSNIIGKKMVRGFQHPLLESNGNDRPNEKGDGRAIRDVLIGYGRKSASTPPEIGTTPDPVFLTDETTAEIMVGDVTGLNDITSVIAVVVPPSGSQAELPTIELAYSQADDCYSGTYDGFSEDGRYAVNVYAIDSLNLYSLPKATFVYRNVDMVKGDLNDDGAVDLTDAIIALKALVGLNVSESIRPDYAASGIDVDGNGMVGLAEMLYTMQVIVGLQ